MTTAPAVRAGRRTTVRLVLAAVIALVGLVLGAGPASAHTELLRTDPAQGSVLATAPSTATLTFNEPIRVVREGVHLYAADGTDLPVTATSSDSRVAVDLPDRLDGTVTLAWRVISADGHPVAGALSFSVGTPSARVAAAAVATRTPSSVRFAVTFVQVAVYLGIFVAVGLVVFLRLFLPRDPSADALRARLLRVARRGADVGMIASALLLPLTRINQRGDGLGAMFAARSWQVDLSQPEPQVAGLVFLGLGLCVATFGGGRIAAALPFAGATMALTSLALVGHTRSFGPPALVIGSDLVHLAAASVWLGGLIGLTLSLRHLGDTPSLAARTVSRFSTVAAGLLAAVAVTGSVLAWRILGSFTGFVSTDFGRTLLVKLGLVAVVLALAALNRWRLLPNVLTAERDDHATATRKLRRTVRVEGLLLIAVLAVTGVLVDRSPEPTAATASAPALFRATGEAAGTRVGLTLDPARIGSNRIGLVLTGGDGQPLTPYDEPVLTLVHDGLRLADLPLTDLGPGSFRAEVALPKAGRWTAEVTVRTGEFESRVIAIGFTVPG